jgi:hypothetical protein
MQKDSQKTDKCFDFLTLFATIPILWDLKTALDTPLFKSQRT